MTGGFREADMYFVFPKGYDILTRELFGLFLAKWPELERENFPLRVCVFRSMNL